MHELLISEEELSRTTKFNNYYIINPILPELQKREIFSPVLTKEYSSADSVLNKSELERLLRAEGMLDY